MRAYGADDELPRSWHDLFDPSALKQALAEQSSGVSLIRSDEILVLFGSDTLSAAVDFESKFHESRLANVQLADYLEFCAWTSPLARATSQHYRGFFRLRKRPRNAEATLNCSRGRFRRLRRRLDSQGSPQPSRCKRRFLRLYRRTAKIEVAILVVRESPHLDASSIT